MVKNHIKRVAAPKQWNILRKEDKYITRQNPGAHTLELSLALNNMLKDFLKVTKTTKETKYVLTEQGVLVNNIKRKDHKAQVGFLDTITIPSIKKSYRITIDQKGMLKPKEIKEEHADLILKITGKTKIKAGKVQINTLSGNNIILAEAEAKKYKLGDTIIAGFDNKIKAHLSLEKGAHVLITTGKHASKYGDVISIKNNIIEVKTDKETFDTNKAYALVINKEKRAELD